jgi:hypothetical protein
MGAVRCGCGRCGAMRLKVKDKRELFLDQARQAPVAVEHVHDPGRKARPGATTTGVGSACTRLTTTRSLPWLSQQHRVLCQYDVFVEPDTVVHAEKVPIAGHPQMMQDATHGAQPRRADQLNLSRSCSTAFRHTFN